MEQGNSMTLTIPDNLLAHLQMTEEEVRQEFALWLFGQEKLTLAQASRFAQVDRLSFQHLLASRGLTLHYIEEDFEQDLATLRNLGRL
jgi:predicted HTH domain antitoxin